MYNKLMLAIAGAVVTLGFAISINQSNASATEASPPGNNGTIKIAETIVEGQEPSNENDPHIAGCNVSVKYFGFDEGSRTSSVTFESQSPTPDTLVSPSGAQPVTFTGSGSGDNLDHTATFALDFEGTPQENQGYHVKVTVTTDGAQGNDTKSKVFWVEGCEEEETNPNTSLTAVCDVSNQVVRLKFINSGDAESNISVNGAASTVAAGETVNVTTPITGAKVSVNVVIDDVARVVNVTCPTGGSGTVTPLDDEGDKVTPAVVTTRGSGAAGITSLPVTSGGSENVAAIVALITSVLSGAGAYIVRMRNAAML